MSFSPLLDALINAFCCLPGVGPKSAQRMAFHLLRRNRKRGSELAASLMAAMRDIAHCERCNTFSETPICRLCQNPKRDPNQLCVVESPSDVLAIEQTGHFFGYYFVLMGHLSPLDGIGPAELGLDKLQHRLETDPIAEVILATNPTVEGEVTAEYISKLSHKQGIKATRIAYGVPVGGELEFIDGNTLTRAFMRRDVIAYPDTL